jgi:hypothetical protein
MFEPGVFFSIGPRGPVHGVCDGVLNPTHFICFPGTPGNGILCMCGCCGDAVWMLHIEMVSSLVHALLCYILLEQPCRAAACVCRAWLGVHRGYGCLFQHQQVHCNPTADQSEGWAASSACFVSSIGLLLALCRYGLVVWCALLHLQWLYGGVCTASPQVALHRGDWSTLKKHAGLVGVEDGCTHQVLLTVCVIRCCLMESPCLVTTV